MRGTICTCGAEQEVGDPSQDVGQMAEANLLRIRRPGSGRRALPLSKVKDAMVVAVRRHRLLALDDCLCALQPSIPRQHCGGQDRRGKLCLFVAVDRTSKFALAQFVGGDQSQNRMEGPRVLARRLKTFGCLTPYAYICKKRTSEPDRYIVDLIHRNPGVST